MWPTATIDAAVPLAINGHSRQRRSARSACSAGRPVVALESTIISHGMPYPQNIEMACDVESIVREHGATPATIAVIDGVCRSVWTQAGHRVARQSSRTCTRPPHATCRGWSLRGATGATTVAATMHLAVARRASGCSRPAASAVCTAARRRPSTSRPISPNWPPLPLPWCAPE